MKTDGISTLEYATVVIARLRGACVERGIKADLSERTGIDDVLLLADRCGLSYKDLFSMR